MAYYETVRRILIIIFVINIATGPGSTKSPAKPVHSPDNRRVIVDLAKSVEGVCTCHGVRTRGMAAEIYVDLHGCGGASGAQGLLRE
jgi:hypothetical protein